VSGRHNLTSEDGREVAGPVVFLDAFDGWVRETTLPQGQYATESVVSGSDYPPARHYLFRSGHRRPSHRRPSHAFVSADPLTAVLVSSTGQLERPSHASS
jgi:hypothetical protein